MKLRSLFSVKSLSCGRVAHGEEFQYRRFQNIICIYQGGRIVYRIMPVMSRNEWI